MPNTPKKEWERLYPIVEPLVEKMRAKYPPELNIDGFEPALTQDIVEIVDSVTASRDEALIEKVSEIKHVCGEKNLYCADSVLKDYTCPLWTGYEQAKGEIAALIRGSKET